MLKYPNMREELLCVLRELGDNDFQNEFWLKKSHDLNRWPYLSDVSASYHWFEDQSLVEDTDHAVGLYLKDHEEANLVRSVVQNLDRVLNDVGKWTSDFDRRCINHPLWPEVIRTALLAHLFLTKDISE